MLLVSEDPAYSVQVADQMFTVSKNLALKNLAY